MVQGGQGLGRHGRLKHSLEEMEQLKRKIDDASRYVPLENLCLSQDGQWRKLERVVETARGVWR